MTDRAHRKEMIRLETSRLTRDIRTAIQRRLMKIVGRQACIDFVAFRLGVSKARAKKILCEQTNLRIEQISDLCLAAGCEPTINVRRVEPQ